MPAENSAALVAGAYRQQPEDQWKLRIVRRTTAGLAISALCERPSRCAGHRPITAAFFHALTVVSESQSPCSVCFALTATFERCRFQRQSQKDQRGARVGHERAKSDGIARTKLPEYLRIQLADFAEIPNIARRHRAILKCVYGRVLIPPGVGPIANGSF